MDFQERLRLGREALQDNVLPSKDEAIFLYDLIQDLQEDITILQKGHEAASRVVEGMSNDYEQMTADRDYWKTKFLLSQKQ